MDLCDRNDIQALLARHGFRFAKSLGQNFLIEGWVAEDIAAASGADADTGVVEVGPGIGSLTTRLARRAGKVVSVELDRRLYPVLAETMADYPNFTLVEGDVMQLSLSALVREHLAGLRPVLCANLPYNITTPFLTACVEARCFDSLTVLIQKEVAQRICAAPGTADYGAFTLLMQYYADQGLGGDMLERYVEDSLQAQYAYAMLFDADATARSDSTFTIYQGSWTFQVSGDLSAEQMSAFEYLLPEGFDGTLTTDAMLDGTDEGGEITLKIPAGTYDVVALSRSAERGLFSSLSNVDNEDFVKGYGEYTFEPGKTYHFTVDYSLEKVKYGWETIDYPCELLRLTVTDSEPETPVTPVTRASPRSLRSPPCPSPMFPRMTGSMPALPMSTARA